MAGNSNLLPSGYDVLGTAASFAGKCQKWVEENLLGHSGVYINPIASTYSPDFHWTQDASSIPAGVSVVFSANATTNGNQGHAGISNGGGVFTSVWSNGEIVKESISQFAKDNGVTLLGWTDFGQGAKPGAIPAPTQTTPLAQLAGQSGATAQGQTQGVSPAQAQASPAPSSSTPSFTGSLEGLLISAMLILLAIILFIGGIIALNHTRIGSALQQAAKEGAAAA